MDLTKTTFLRVVDALSRVHRVAWWALRLVPLRNRHNLREEAFMNLADRVEYAIKTLVDQQARLTEQLGELQRLFREDAKEDRATAAQLRDTDAALERIERDLRGLVATVDALQSQLVDQQTALRDINARVTRLEASTIARG